MIASTLYIRTVPQENGDWQLLASWEKPVVQRTCAQLTSLTAVTEKSLAAVVESIKQRYQAADVKDVTPPAVQRQLAKQFERELAAKVLPV